MSGPSPLRGRIPRSHKTSRSLAPAQGKITGGLADPADVLKPDPTP